VTWEQVLNKMRPRLARLIGFCHCCGRKFDDVSVIIT
jgi:hypothetical protein